VLFTLEKNLVMKHRGFAWELGEEVSAWGWREEGESLTLFGSVFVGEGEDYD